MEAPVFSRVSSSPRTSTSQPGTAVPVCCQAGPRSLYRIASPTRQLLPALLLPPASLQSCGSGLSGPDFRDILVTRYDYFPRISENLASLPHSLATGSNAVQAPSPDFSPGLRSQVRLQWFRVRAWTDRDSRRCLWREGACTGPTRGSFSVSLRGSARDVKSNADLRLRRQSRAPRPRRRQACLRVQERVSLR